MDASAETISSRRTPDWSCTVFVPATEPEAVEVFDCKDPARVCALLKALFIFRRSSEGISGQGEKKKLAASQHWPSALIIMRGCVAKSRGNDSQPSFNVADGTGAPIH